MVPFSRPERGFSLTEVIIALGIFAFCVVALLNLLTAGIQTSGQTEQRLDASNTAQMLIEMRRLYPTNPPGTEPTLGSWGLPEIRSASLTAPLTGEAVISEDGVAVPETSAQAAYRLKYRLSLPSFMESGGSANTNCVNVHLYLAPLRPAGKLRAYEIASAITLP